MTIKRENRHRNSLRRSALNLPDILNVEFTGFNRICQRMKEQREAAQLARQFESSW
jgi:hypothetical protein